MHKAVKRVALGLLMVLIIVIGLASWAYYPQVSNLKSEYTTAEVIRDLEAYVVANPGEWPKSWQDLGDGSDLSAYTRFRFDLSVDSVLRQPELIHEAATPIRGTYLTYPHAKAQLDEVLRKLQENAEEPKFDTLPEDKIGSGKI